MHIPAVTDILETASHVAVYDFTPEGTWVKKGIEGTLFLFQRDVEPFYGFFVMNRLDPENLTVLLGPDLETQVLGDYLMYKLPNGLLS